MTPTVRSTTALLLLALTGLASAAYLHDLQAQTSIQRPVTAGRDRSGTSSAAGYQYGPPEGTGDAAGSSSSSINQILGFGTQGGVGGQGQSGAQQGYGSAHGGLAGSQVAAGSAQGGLAGQGDFGAQSGSGAQGGFGAQSGSGAQGGFGAQSGFGGNRGFGRPSSQNGYSGVAGAASSVEEAIAELGAAIGGGGVAGEDYPILASVPDTGFSCLDHSLPGYYADTAPEAGCQVFHICQEDGRQDSFLCPNGSVFNQQYFVCDWWYNFDCSTAEQLYELNANIGDVEAIVGSASSILGLTNGYSTLNGASQNGFSNGGNRGGSFSGFGGGDQFGAAAGQQGSVGQRPGGVAPSQGYRVPSASSQGVPTTGQAFGASQGNVLNGGLVSSFGSGAERPSGLYNTPGK